MARLLTDAETRELATYDHAPIGTAAWHDAMKRKEAIAERRASRADRLREMDRRLDAALGGFNRDYGPRGT